MMIIEKTKVTSSELNSIQLSAIKSRAEALWGDNWLAKLVAEYEKVLGDGKAKSVIVRRWFASEGTVPSLGSFNNLLLAVGCKMAIEYEAVATVRLEKLL